MNSSLAMSLVMAALAVAAAALVVALVALGRTRSGVRRRLSARRGARQVPADLEGLRTEVSALRTEVSEALRHVAVVRYDAFGDMGGHLSWSMALLDDGGNGVVVTSIHGRSEARTYAKNITGWKCDQALSPEEDEAVGFARVG